MGNKFTTFELSCICALTLAALAIAARTMVLVHRENDDGPRFQEMRLALHVALSMVLAMTVDVGIDPAFVWLQQTLPHDGTLANRVIAAVLTGLGCVVVVIVVPWGMVAFQRSRRDVSTARRATSELIDRLRAGCKEPAVDVRFDRTWHAE
ncbi:hypothetical protein ACLKMY_17320 [Paraburkholderia mimosarum]|uniref:hypothetical protein n=1 Tax=Paraburkholderia mimosarum TaxID=312026 RepID=UPI0039C43149